MAYDEGLAIRIEEMLAQFETPNIEPKKMFGGVGFMLNGNMSCGVHKDYLIVRVGPVAYPEALKHEHTSEFDITGRPMTGWVTVDADGYESDEDLRDWITKGINFALTLPEK